MGNTNREPNVKHNDFWEISIYKLCKKLIYKFKYLDWMASKSTLQDKHK